jgi:hypothetical protein
MSTATASAPQHMTALQLANRVRLARAATKQRIADGEVTVAELLSAEPVPWEIESMAIADLLMSQHRWGRSRMQRFLSPIPMLETKKIGTMTSRQRTEVAARLTPFAWDYDRNCLAVDSPEPPAEPPPAAPAPEPEPALPDPALAAFAKLRGALEDPDPTHGGNRPLLARVG